jgi:hypothetical protein
MATSGSCNPIAVRAAILPRTLPSVADPVPDAAAVPEAAADADTDAETALTAGDGPSPHSSLLTPHSESDPPHALSRSVTHPSRSGLP